MAAGSRLVLCLGEQHMEPICWDGCVPAAWKIEHLPDVDDARPRRCPCCRSPARIGSKIVVQGHGVRVRQVVVAPALDDQPPILAECWSRRYRCVACGAVPTVLPIGVMPRFLYSALAIVAAFVLVGSRPLGKGLSDEAAYARQGMFRLRGWTKPEPYRWRSLDRWSASIASWWPGLPTEIDGLLAGLVRRAGAQGLQTLLKAATASHVRWGSGM